MAQSPPFNPASAGSRPRPVSAVLARLALAVAVPVLFFCALEGTLRLAGFGKQAGFFIPDEKPGFFRTNPDFTAPFIPSSFGIQPLNFRLREHKEPGTVRVFVLGESAAQGMPEPGLGFAAQLGVQLRARDPGRRFEVFNLGITAINSHVVYQIARDLPRFEPDLFVIYMGNNEVVGPYGPGCAYMASNPPLWVIRASVWVRGTRSGQLLLKLLGKLSLAPARAQEWKGMETFSENSVRGDDPRLEAVYHNFSANLQDIVDLANGAGAKTVLATVVANLKDSAPFISQHRAGLSADETRAWHGAYDAGMIAWDLGDGESALYEFKEALRIDPQFAEAHFRAGTLEEGFGADAQARVEYLEALHWDALRFRPDPRINAIIRDTAGRAGSSVLLVDAATAMGSDANSRVPLSGHEILFDHVHFNWTGSFQVAQLLADGCARQLLGHDAHPGGGLDGAGCAASLGYTPDAEARMLKVIATLTLKPPFTGQFTFSEDQARSKREIELVSAQLGTAEARTACLDTMEKALQLDPDNGSLALRLGIMESDAGNLGRALALLERAGTLQPPSAEISWRKAQVLIRMRRYDEAQALLLGSLKMDEDYYSAGGELVELWGSTKQFDIGRRFFAERLAEAPGNHYLRLEYANFLALSGDWSGAEGEARRIWDEDPGSRTATAALEFLIRIYERQRRTDAADALTLAASAPQADDYFNNQRLVEIYAGRNDTLKVAESLQALAASGPFDAAQHLDLAHRMAELNRRREMLDELAQARGVAQFEGDDPQLKKINDLIDVYRKRFSDGQAQ